MIAVSSTVTSSVILSAGGITKNIHASTLCFIKILLDDFMGNIRQLAKFLGCPLSLEDEECVKTTIWIPWGYVVLALTTRLVL